MKKSSALIKPCPYCGGEWVIGQEPEDNGSVAGMYYAYHVNTNCEMDQTTYHFTTREELVRSLNARVPIATTERYDIVDYLRQGGQRINGVFHGWDSEMAGYAIAFADMIEAGEHQK